MRFGYTGVRFLMNVSGNSLIFYFGPQSYGSLCVCGRGLLSQVASERARELRHSKKIMKKSTTAETFKENHNNGAPRALKPKTTAETFKEKQTKDYVSESDDDGGGDDENHKKHMEI